MECDFQRIGLRTWHYRKDSPCQGHISEKFKNNLVTYHYYTFELVSMLQSLMFCFLATFPLCRGKVQELKEEELWSGVFSRKGSFIMQFLPSPAFSLATIMLPLTWEGKREIISFPWKASHLWFSRECCIPMESLHIRPPDLIVVWFWTLCPDQWLCYGKWFEVIHGV